MRLGLLLLVVVTITEAIPVVTHLRVRRADNTIISKPQESDVLTVLKVQNLVKDFVDNEKSENNVLANNAISSSASEPRVARQYMTGNIMLDKIMNCPCQKEQLMSMGLKGFENQPDPAIYRNPPYGPNALGPGDFIASNLKSVGGSTGNAVGQLTRFLLGLPSMTLSFLKPLVVGAVDTLSQTTDAAAGITSRASKSLPGVIRAGASVLKTLLETAGDLFGGVLHIISNLTESISAVKTSLSGILPLVFDALGTVSGRVSQSVGPAVEWISDTKGIVSDGIVQAAKSSGNLFSGFVEGTQGFKTGLLEGIKLGVSDETSPPPESNAWR